MRILYVTSGLPYPLTSGRLRHYYLIRELAKRHEVVLLALDEDGARPEDVEALRSFGRVELFGGSGREPAPSRSLPSRAVRFYRDRDGAALTAEARRLIEGGAVDVVLVAGRRGFRILPRLPDTAIVADVCDATSLHHLARARITSGRDKAVHALSYLVGARLERATIARADAVLFASERDRAAVHVAGSDAREWIVPNGIDADYWSRTAPRLGSDVVITGAMDYGPNVDAAIQLADRIMPLVRSDVEGARLLIVGRDPLPELIERSRDATTVTGFVDDVRPYLDAAGVFVAPLRFGAGIQNKLLEAMAMEVPAIASPLAAAGLRGADGTEPPITVAHDPAQFATAIVKALAHAAKDGTPDNGARAHVVERFAWPAAAETVEAALENAIDRSRSRARSRITSVPPPSGQAARSSVPAGPRSEPAPRGRRLRRGVRSNARPPGLTVALVGLDGAGKTTVSARLPAILNRQTAYVYMGVNPESSNRLLPTTRLIHALRRRRRGIAAGGRPVVAEAGSGASSSDSTSRPASSRVSRVNPIRAVLSGLRLANRIAEELFRQKLAARYRSQGMIVIQDRDFLFDFYASDVVRGGSRTLPRRLHGFFLTHFYTRPDLLLFLDAPAEVLFARKGEGTIESLTRRRREYHEALPLAPNHAVIDATSSLEEVTALAAGMIERTLAGRDGSGGEGAPSKLEPEASSGAEPAGLSGPPDARPVTDVPEPGRHPAPNPNVGAPIERSNDG